MVSFKNEQIKIDIVILFNAIFKYIAIEFVIKKIRFRKIIINKIRNSTNVNKFDVV